MKDLLKTYEIKKERIRNTLDDFKQMYKQSDEKIFSELCYCIMTAAGRADNAITAQKRLEKYILTDNRYKIIKKLEGVRFKRRKAGYIIHNRKNLTQGGKIKIKHFLSGNVYELRERLAKDKEHFKGLSYKEASHFLRNIGFGKNFAILDRHILRALKGYGVIGQVPKYLTRGRYLEIEQKMAEFADKIKVPLADLDLLLWSEETGEIRK